MSAQCGTAVLLKQLQQGGKADVDAGPRTLQLTNPMTTGPDVEDAQRLLSGNRFGSFDPGPVDGAYGELTAGATRRAKWELGYPEGAVNSTFGPRLRAFLAGAKQLPRAFRQRRAERLRGKRSERAVRRQIIRWALWGCRNRDRIGYSQNGSVRLSALGERGHLPLATDCSAFVTLCYCWAGAPNPNASGPYDPRAAAYTGSMLSHLRRIPRTAAKPGDLVVWTPPSTGWHVCIVIAPGSDPLLVSHGDSSGPTRLRFSVEHAYQRRHGHGQTTWLTAF
ncbi:MAG TPA: peptidoglycan-binding domain-containing protein [Gaiellaceae bacterium]|nr:peptidoglycan-binding domain-containing protein [Gaiellaceae bacterium]